MNIEDIEFEEGAYLVRIARRAIETYLLDGSRIKVDPPYKVLKSNFGVFVTLNLYPKGLLRGCIGYPEPILPLYKATIEAAIAAATEDPRFPPLSIGELSSVVVEVSILSPPEKIIVDSREKLPEKVVIGKHGLIVRSGWFGGLLLPQVAVEYGWNSKEFLDQTCIKAGMQSGCWLREDVDVYRFSARIFKEEAPAGKVVGETLKRY